MLDKEKRIFDAVPISTQTTFMDAAAAYAMERGINGICSIANDCKNIRESKEISDRKWQEVKG